MHWIDASIFILYMISLVAIGFHFMRKNQDADDYFVSGRNMTRWHIGLSVVATDVGGGFSIGLGGLGFMTGLSGSWMLFTGLIGAWLSAVILIPKIYKLGSESKFMTFPQVFNHFFNRKVAFIAGIISAIGYLGFTSSQILAGAKLASASFDGLSMTTALLIMGGITVGYTVLGGMKAVIYTDTIQWIVLIGGLFFVGLPLAYYAVGGYETITQTLRPEFFSLTNVSWQTVVNWTVTIIPIWFVGMTLYQRIYASKSEKEAKKAWFIAGLFEWPIMAFMGVLLGLFARVAAENGMFAGIGFATANAMDPEMGLPLLLKQILPIGLLGIMMSVYFSAILSTADSCLMAASGNVLTDIISVLRKKPLNDGHLLKLSQLLTFVLGIIAIVLASMMENVLNMMLYSYAFMVSGLLIPLIAAVFFKQTNSKAALMAMLGGGFTTLFLTLFIKNLPLGLDPNLFGITVSLLLFFIGLMVFPQKKPALKIN
ncbi:sodium:solute symporter family protein [Pedobacter sp. SD-b]|uniref:Sodium:solute symporter family protein n=1 Tax=Pedobacter segetis TaxID=2793069 RepID=A0ABS1BIT5_9SPHI|nr:sodium:solute symporter family protein [Pedobacter segetis]MBK0382770.1 sodium:solute symporter family protein [Pedobacter segetis]